MDGADAFAVSSSPWSLVRGYFSPATLFLLLNMVIGTIALTSRSHRRRRDDDDGGHHHHQQRQHVHHQPHHQYALAPPPPLARTSSVMERLSSLGLYRFLSGDFPPEYNHHLSAATHDATTAAHPSSAMKKSTSGSEVKKLERAPPQAQVRRAPRAPAPRGLVARQEDDDAAAVSVDARADDFINKFRQQLQLQRLNSLLNYKEMLNRGL